MAFFAAINFASTQGVARVFLGIILSYLTLAVVLAIIYMLFQLVTSGNGLGGLFGGGSGRTGRGGNEPAPRPPRTPREGAERALPPGIPQNIVHDWDAPNTRYLLRWEARPGDENVVEYEVQRREAPSLRNLGTRRFLTGNLIAGWQTIGRSTAPTFIDTGASHRWRINPRNITYPGNRQLRPNLAYQYRLRAINNQNRHGPWGNSVPAQRGPGYDVRPEIRLIRPTAPLQWFVPVTTEVEGAIVVDHGNAAGRPFRLDWWAFPAAERAFAENMVQNNLDPGQAPAHHGVLHRTNNLPAPSQDHAVLPALDYNTLTGHIVCLGLFDPTTNEWRWDRREIPAQNPIIVIPARIQGGQPIILIQ